MAIPKKPEPIILRGTLQACRVGRHDICVHLTAPTHHNQPWRTVCICECHDNKEFI